MHDAAHGIKVSRSGAKDLMGYILLENNLHFFINVKNGIVKLTAVLGTINNTCHGFYASGKHM